VIGGAACWQLIIPLHGAQGATPTTSGVGKNRWAEKGKRISGRHCCCGIHGGKGRCRQLRHHLPGRTRPVGWVANQFAAMAPFPHGLWPGRECPRPTAMLASLDVRSPAVASPGIHFRPIVLRPRNATGLVWATVRSALSRYTVRFDFAAGTHVVGQKHGGRKRDQKQRSWSRGPAGRPDHWVDGR